MKTKTIKTTYTKDFRGCCLTFTGPDGPRAIDGGVGAHAYHQVDEIAFVGQPVMVTRSPRVYQCEATEESLLRLRSRPVRIDDPLDALLDITGHGPAIAAD
jgi:hypothetical protein